ncbi:hypothetical protein TNCV_1792591 [Trichonephila clavipes]|nr:hypothetical protein TNCV_1792591 [Trichonephila clavipes]
MVMDSWWPWKSSGQGIGLWLACYEFEPSTTKDPPSIRSLLATVFVILNHGQVMKTTPELAPRSPNFHNTSTGGRLSLKRIRGKILGEPTPLATNR